MKELVLYYIDGSTAQITIDFDTVQQTYSNLMVRQERDGTRVWNRKTGENVEMPRKRYTLSSKEGQQQLLDDLESLGLAGKHYSVSNAIRDSDSFGTRNSQLEDELMSCYENDFDLGWFFDLETLEAEVDRCQSRDDLKAQEVLEAHGIRSGLEGGPCYYANVWCDDDDKQVEF